MEIFMILAIILASLMPYIICLILAILIIGVIDTKTIKSKKRKILIITIIIFCVCIVVFNIKKENPSDLYIEMNKIDDNGKLIGLSQEEVIALLGTPKDEYKQEDSTILRFNAGNIGKGLYLFNKAIFFDCYDVYVLSVSFNKDDKAEYTAMYRIP